MSTASAGECIPACTMRTQRALPSLLWRKFPPRPPPHTCPRHTRAHIMTHLDSGSYTEPRSSSSAACVRARGSLGLAVGPAPSRDAPAAAWGTIDAAASAADAAGASAEAAAPGCSWRWAECCSVLLPLPLPLLSSSRSTDTFDRARCGGRPSSDDCLRLGAPLSASCAAEELWLPPKKQPDAAMLLVTCDA